MLSDIKAAMADLIRETVAASLLADDIDVEVEPRYVMAPSEGVCIDVFLASGSARSSEDVAFGDLAGGYALTVRARVVYNESDDAQDILDAMNDDQHELSVPAAIDSDPTLDGWATYVYVDPDGFSGVGDASFGATQLVGCTWRVLVGAAES